MSDVETPLTDQGQSQVAPETGSTEKPAGTEGSTVQQQAQPGTTEEQFIDPSDLPPELQAHFKRMQKSFTKKMQSFKDIESKAAIVDQFNRDPHTAIQRLAQQYGYNLGQPSQANQSDDGEWQPTNWSEVLQKATEQAEQNIMQQLAPLYNEMKTVKKTQIESTLDEHVPEWREYEDDMTALLSKHPSLANDPEALVRMAVPDKVIQGRAYQKALKSLQEKGEAAKISKGTQVNKPVEVDPNRKPTFQEAYSNAKRQIASQG